MDVLKISAAQARFADIIWENEPLSSRTLVEICGEVLHWKKSTTYTVLKLLCDKGIFQNQSGTVSSIVSREMYVSAKSIQLKLPT